MDTSKTAIPVQLSWKKKHLWTFADEMETSEVP